MDILVFEYAFLDDEMIDDLRAAIGPDLDLLVLNVRRGVVRHNGTVVSDTAVLYPAVPSPGFLGREPRLRGASAELAAHNVMTYIQHLYAERLRSRAMRGCYGEIEKDCGFNSNEKFELAGGAALVASKRVLDVESNDGYFPNHYAVADPPPSSVVGIGTARANVQRAQCYSSMIMGTSKITSFRTESFLELDNPDASYDVISCTSAFHRFRGKDQRAFMDQARRLLGKKGVLVLEVGLSRKNQGTPFTEKYTRMKGKMGNETCFPNIERLQALAEGYTLIRWGPSIDQGADKLPRMVFHFSLDPNATEIPFPLYSDLK